MDLFGGIGTLDPAIGSDYEQFTAYINLYDNLITQTPNGAPAPNVAYEWSVSSNGLTYVLTIHSGITFHSGDIMSAADVVFSMQRNLALQQGVASDWLPELTSSGVTMVNSTAVQFQLTKPFAPFLGSLSLLFIVDKNLVMQHLTNVTSTNPMGDWGTGWLTTNDAGSGPYMLQNWQRDTVLTLTKFGGFWKGWASNPQAFQTIKFDSITTEATILSLAKEGQMNWVGTYVSVPTYQSLKSMGWTWGTYASPQLFDLMINTQSPPLNNVFLRRALSYAFNYSEMPILAPGAVQSEGPVANTYQYHDPNVFVYRTNITAAKAEFALSGLNPATTTITITYVSGSITEQEIAEEFQKDVENALGITVNIAVQTWETFTQLAAHASTSPQIVTVYTATLYPDTDTYFYPFYDSLANGTWASAEWVDNSTINNLISQEENTSNTTLRQQIFNQLQVDIVNLAPDIFCFNSPSYVALSPNVGGYVYYNQFSFDSYMYNIKNLG